jgi:DNA-binding transcriptional regulator YiaG
MRKRFGRRWLARPRRARTAHDRDRAHERHQGLERDLAASTEVTKMKTTGASCSKCGAKALSPAKFSATRKVAGHAFKDDLDASRCGACGEVLVDGASFEAFDLRVALELARAGFATPDALQFMRSATGLRGKDLGALLGLSAEHISRVETGRAPADKRTVGLLAALLEDQSEGTTRTLDQLRAQGHPRKPGGTIRLPKASAAKTGRRR